MSTPSKATLQLALTEKILAYQLEGVIFIINELYTGYCWLEQAEKHEGPEPYGDSTFAYEDFLQVKKVEIGTPNLIELHGWIKPLAETITYLGGISGIVSLLKDGSDIFKNWKEARKAKEEPKPKTLYEQAVEAEQLQKIKLENEKLLLEIEEMKRTRQRKEDPSEKSYRLYLMGKASEAVVQYKQGQQERIKERLPTIENIVIHMTLIPD